MIVSRSFHLCDLGLIPKIRMCAEICQSQSDSEGFSLGTPVFLPLQIGRQDLCREMIKHWPLAHWKLTLNEEFVVVVVVVSVVV